MVQAVLDVRDETALWTLLIHLVLSLKLRFKIVSSELRVKRVLLTDLEIGMSYYLRQRHCLAADH